MAVDTLSTFLEVARKKPRFAFGALIPLLLDLEERKLTLPDPVTSSARPIAQAVARAFADPRAALTPEQFVILCHFSDRVDALLRVGGGVDVDALKAKIVKSKNPATRRRSWPLCRLHNLQQRELRALESAPPAIRIPVTLSLLATSHVLTPEAEAMRTVVLQRSDRLLEGALPGLALSMFSEAWMKCSYAAYPDKHDAKAAMNRVATRWLEGQGVRAGSAEIDARPERARPRVVVFAERMQSNHAMYRCYGPAIQQLRDDFEVILVGEARDLDDGAEALAEQVVRLPRHFGDYAGLVRTIRQLAPDVVYYPSLGMRLWTILLCNLRLAPLQIMTLGHPATARSSAIDFAITEEGYVGDPGVYAESFYLLRDFGFPFSRSSDPRSPLPPDIREAPEVVRIAVPSNNLKLNADFLKTLKTICDDARRPVEPWFFPAQADPLLHARTELDLKGLFPKARVYPYMGYEDYLRLVNACDLHFSPFPFGGTNSNMDSLGQGLPVLCRAGREGHARGDAAIAERLGLGTALVAVDDDDYVRRGLRLVEDDAHRVALSRQALEPGRLERFFGASGDFPEGELAKAFRFLYAHQDALRGAGRVVVGYRDAESADQYPLSRASAR